jgi:hypothetical protein
MNTFSRLKLQYAAPLLGILCFVEGRIVENVSRARVQ